MTSYPVVSDSISTFESNPLGKKSLDLTKAGYDTFVAPVAPYAKRPYGYVAPYVEKADSLASDGLTKFDNQFPIIKEETQKIKGSILDLAYMPFRLADDGKNYLLDTYSSEYQKCGGDGYISGGKAIITTGLVVTSDTLTWLGSFLSQKKDEGTDYAAKKYGAASNYVTAKSDEAANFAHDKSEQAKKLAYQKTDEAKDAAGQAKDTAQAKGQQAKETAKDKANGK